LRDCAQCARGDAKKMISGGGQWIGKEHASVAKAPAHFYVQNVRAEARTLQGLQKGTRLPAHLCAGVF
jgi:hypothetical protein